MIGSSTKKRPNGLVFARMFDNKVLDMCEFGVENFKPMSEFKVEFTPLSYWVVRADVVASDTRTNTWSSTVTAFRIGTV